MKNNKRAQIFSILVILLIGLMFVTFELFSVLGERHTVKTRVSSMDNFLNSVETNLERQMYISGFRIIFLAENQITSTGNYIPDVQAFFNESFFKTLNGSEEFYNISFGTTYSDLINSLNEKASKINVDITLTNSKVNVSQEDPWHVKFTLTSDFLMEDRENLASWNKQQVISAYIPVEGFEDPIYTINTFSKVSRKIAQTPYEGSYVVGSDVSNLLAHVNNGYYAANSDAPSFLKRLEGDFSSDSNGIEGFVKIPDLSNQGIPVSIKSCVDHIYFSASNPSYSSVSGMPSWFYIDDGHKSKYNLS